ncbi:MAG TPA: di-trans,poly-cis-decaprenylcistransferase [Euryarchaeota archaeon]|nr:(2Z,6E)-farnesyl diphosphate synthase [archaeon BMS3Bbin16]HDH28475.1 di-trans,poly-cis-decaprenylcistransferase [Euryarchaeota archaeon]HDY73587.1 di-trans,poly-cis-decaprenylcistransferase [Euryarchaeota archaeon]
MAGIILRPIYSLYEYRLLRSVKKHSVPVHIGMIMDGNRRAASALRIMPWEGHRMGAEKVDDVIEWCIDIGVETATLYAFSTENFQRPPEELEHLFDLFEEFLSNVAGDERIHKNKVRVKAIGKTELFPNRVQKAIENAEESTKKYDGFLLQLAMAYGGREEVLDAVRRIAVDVKSGVIEPDSITEETIRKRLYTNGAPDPQLIIRTSGEERISNFLLWQSAYSELYFCETNWPMFRRIDFLRAIRTYQDRERRFGR